MRKNKSVSAARRAPARARGERLRGGLRRLRMPESVGPRKASREGPSFPVIAALSLVLFLSCGFLLYQLREFRKAGIVLEPDAPVFYSDQFITFTLNVRNPFLRGKWLAYGPPDIFIKDEEGKALKTIGGLDRALLAYDRMEEVWRGRFPCPWKPKPGHYKFSMQLEPKQAKQFVAHPFEIARREPQKVKKGLVVLTLEYAGWHGSLKLRGPDGQQKDWTAIADWAQYFGADAVWVLAGRSSFVRGRVWDPVDTQTLKKLGALCHSKNIMFGVWVMSYITQPEKGAKTPRYVWSLSSEQGGLVETKGISLADPQRPADIAAFLAPFAKMDEVDFLGLDYIRNAIGGYEMAEAFYADMNWLPKPSGWDKMNGRHRAEAFAALKIAGRNKEVVDAWQWWRAHKVGQVVRFIKQRVGGRKKFWAFTLGWEKGWQHGQDPIMLRDAGIDVDAVMLYEADKPQYATMMKDWSAYLDKGDLQLLVGDIVDTPLHQGGGSPEYRRRLDWAASDIYGGAPADGIFVHDLMRIVRGRLAPENTESWKRAVKESLDAYRAGPAKL